MYTTYEKLVINRLIEMFPDLAPPLARIVERLVDLHPDCQGALLPSENAGVMVDKGGFTHYRSGYGLFGIDGNS